MTRTLESAREALQSQAFSRLLNTELIAYGADGVQLRLPITDQLKQQHGFAHGGVLSYLADNALTFAGGTALGPAIVTAEYKINYIRPGKGEALIAKARVVHAGRNQAVCQCEVFAVDAGTEKLCALAQGTIARIGEAK